MSRFYEIDIDASCPWNKYGYGISLLWHETQYFIFRQYICIVVLNWVAFILYSLFIIPLGCYFLDTLFEKRCCVCLHMTSQFYEIDIGCIVVNKIDIILKLLSWVRKYNIWFHKNKTILLLFKCFFLKVFTFLSILALHTRV